MRLQVFFGIGAGLILAGSSTQGHAGYENGFPTDPGFFPIGVWQQSPFRAPQFKTIGVNTYVGLWEGPTEIQLSELARAGMFAVAEQNSVGLQSPNRHVIKAWMQSDEPDNAQPIGMGLYGNCIPATQVVRRSREMKALDSTRPVLINFGQGVANEFWKGRGPCNGDQKYYDVAAQDADILSFDIYPVGSSTPQVKGKLEYVARGVTDLVGHAASGQAIWALLETTALDPAVRPLRAQVRAEVWMALTHGAKGIVYFVHEFKPRLREDAIFRYPDIVDEVTIINRLIRSLAPVLNAPNASRKVTVQSPVPIATMLKQHEQALYLFAVAMRNAASRPQFAIEGLDDTQADVLGELRSATIRNGVLEDDFASYGVHLYKIPLPGR